MTTPPVVSITDELIAELEAAANAATPGPWSSSDAIPERSFCGQVWDASESALLCHDKVSSQATADVRFVSQANPATILALLAERAELKQQLAAASVDAERYRFIRGIGGPIYCREIEYYNGNPCGAHNVQNGNLDAAIDAARNIGSGD